MLEFFPGCNPYPSLTFVSPEPHWTDEGKQTSTDECLSRPSNSQPSQTIHIQPSHSSVQNCTGQTKGTRPRLTSAFLVCRIPTIAGNPYPTLTFVSPELHWADEGNQTSTDECLSRLSNSQPSRAIHIQALTFVSPEPHWADEGNYPASVEFPRPAIPTATRKIKSTARPQIPPRVHNMYKLAADIRLTERIISVFQTIRFIPDGIN